MSFLFDTNVLSELRKGTRGDPRLRAWFARVSEDDIYVSVLFVGEVRKGIERVRHRDARKALALEKWLAEVTRAHAARILPVDHRVAEEWGRLVARRSGPVIDLLLAATARVHGLTLATRNLQDVAWTGVACINPFEA